MLNPATPGKKCKGYIAPCDEAVIETGTGFLTKKDRMASLNLLKKDKPEADYYGYISSTDNLTFFWVHVLFQLIAVGIVVTGDVKLFQIDGLNTAYKELAKALAIMYGSGFGAFIASHIFWGLFAGSKWGGLRYGWRALAKSGAVAMLASALGSVVLMALILCENSVSLTGVTNRLFWAIAPLKLLAVAVIAVQIREEPSMPPDKPAVLEIKYFVELQKGLQIIGMDFIAFLWHVILQATTIGVLWGLRKEYESLGIDGTKSMALTSAVVYSVGFVLFVVGELSTWNYHAKDESDMCTAMLDAIALLGIGAMLWSLAYSLVLTGIVIEQKGTQNGTEQFDAYPLALCIVPLQMMAMSTAATQMEFADRWKKYGEQASMKTMSVNLEP